MDGSHTPYQARTPPGRQAARATTFCMLAPSTSYMWVLSVEFAACHPSGSYNFDVASSFWCGPGSSVGIATDYGLDGPGSNLGGDEILRPFRPALGLTQPPVKWVPGLSRGVKCGRGVLLTTHPLLVRGLGRVELYLYAPSGPHRVCNGITLPLPF